MKRPVYFYKSRFGCALFACRKFSAGEVIFSFGKAFEAKDVVAHSDAPNARLINGSNLVACEDIRLGDEIRCDYRDTRDNRDTGQRPPSFQVINGGLAA